MGEYFFHPDKNIVKDIQRIYKQNGGSIGWPKRGQRIFHRFARKNSQCVVGVALGDEGKGRIIDNIIEAFLKKRGIHGITVIRFQGGSNSGHTVQIRNTKIAVHQIPSWIIHKSATCIMDRGMTINPVDLTDEIHLIENITGSVQGRLFLSQDAVLNTDLDRAEEQLNRIKQGKSTGGTGRGIGPSYAHHYDRLGFHIIDLIDSQWDKKFSLQFERYTHEFNLYGLKLSDLFVPDFVKTKHTKKECKHPIGNKNIFLNRLELARKELLSRRMVINTYPMHASLYQKTNEAVLFEGAQALGLHPWLGTIPDITGSDTSVYGIHTGTAFWKMQDIQTRIGVFKIPYTSSVGARRMPTEAHSAWAERIREAAHEYGTTTGRPRDILFPDLPMLSYNIRMSGVEILVGTHLDISWKDMPIKVCTHYIDAKGDIVLYQPGLPYLACCIPQYVTLPGWDGESVRRAKSFRQLPENAKKFLVFLQRRLTTPIVAITTGPSRGNYITIPPCRT